MQLIEYKFTAEMRYGDYRDDNYTFSETAESPREAVIEMVASTVEEFAREQDFEVAKARAEQYISQELGTINWTPEQFCNSWVELWTSDCQLLRVCHMEEIGVFRKQ